MIAPAAFEKPWSLPSPLELAIANAQGTYMALGISVPETTTYEEEELFGVLSRTPHGAGNCAFIERLSYGSIARAAQLGRSRPFFNTYWFGARRDRRWEETFRRAGFGEPLVQSLMVRPTSEPFVADSPVATISKVEDEAARRTTMTALADVFFEFHEPDFRNTLIEATVVSKECEVYSAFEMDRFAGGFMATACAGVWGLYDIGVPEPLQGDGRGAALVRSAVLAAPPGTEWATLQCQEELVGWYGRLGFREVGVFLCFRPQKRPRASTQF